MKTALVLGAGGFIGSHIVSHLRALDYQVTGADLHLPLFSASLAQRFVIGDLRDLTFCQSLFTLRYDRVYQLAADMGGAGYIFTGLHDADIMASSVQINLNVLACCKAFPPELLFFASSACIYPDVANYEQGIYAEASAYPAQPDSEYGWEKLFSERLYQAHARNYGLNVRIARLHNVYGAEGVYDGGKEKAVAAICRKVIKSQENDQIEIWGDGNQTRSFLYIDDCVEGIERLMNSRYQQPINIGSEEIISIQALTQMIINLSGKNLSIKNIKGPQGVAVRTSNNELAQRELDWSPSVALITGAAKTMKWIVETIKG